MWYGQIRSDQIRSGRTPSRPIELWSSRGPVGRGNRTVPGTASRGKVLGGLRPVES